MQRMLRVTACLGLVGCLAGAAAAQTGFEPTDAKSEVDLGRQAAHEIERTIPLSRDPAMQERVKRIGSALVASLPQRAYSYEFKVLAQNEFNAFALPGGFMYVNEGLLASLPDDNAIAFVMAHEMAHVSHRHYRQLVRQSKGPFLLSVVIGAVSGNPGLGALAHELTVQKHSREHETEADRTGVQYLWAAGYDLQGAVEAMQVIAKLDKGSGSVYLRSHPRGADRLKRIEVLCTEFKTRPRPGAAPAAPLPPPELDRAALVGKLPDAVPAVNPWLPLAVGNRWRYAVTGAGGKSGYEIRVVSAIRLEHGSVYRAETILDGGTPVPCQLLTTAAELWRRNRPSASEAAWEVQFPLAFPDDKPLERAGATFLPQKPEPLRTPCGNFTEVLKIRQRRESGTYDLWFARGVGLVQRTCVESGVTETLVDYKVEGK